MKKLIILTALTMTLMSCSSVMVPSVVFKYENYTVTEINGRTAVCENEKRKMTIRNFELEVGDTVVDIIEIPVLNEVTKLVYEFDN